MSGVHVDEDSGSIIKRNREALDAAKIPYEYRLIGSKYYAIVALERAANKKTNKKLMLCLYTCNVIYLKKTYKLKSAEGFLRFMDRNGMVVKRDSVEIKE